MSQSSIEHKIPYEIASLAGASGDGWVIVGPVGTGESKRYPSVKDGHELSPVLDADYWSYKTEVAVRVVRFEVCGNAVLAADYCEHQTKLRCVAIGPKHIDITVIALDKLGDQNAN